MSTSSCSDDKVRFIAEGFAPSGARRLIASDTVEANPLRKRFCCCDAVCAWSFGRCRAVGEKSHYHRSWVNFGKKVGKMLPNQYQPTIFSHACEPVSPAEIVVGPRVVERYRGNKGSVALAPRNDALVPRRVNRDRIILTTRLNAVNQNVNLHGRL
jgi:hypothetical protein